MILRLPEKRIILPNRQRGFIVPHPVGFMGAQVGGAGAVGSVEKVTLTLSTAETTKSQDLSKGQDWSQCVPWRSTCATVSAVLSNQSKRMVECEVYDNAGTAAVRVTRDASTNIALEVHVFVVEFNSDIAIQKLPFTITGASSSDTVTCSAVDQSKAFAIAHARFSTDETALGKSAFKVLFTSNTQVRIERDFSSPSGEANGFIYVVEDTTDNHFTVQTVAGSHQALGDFDKSITAVDTGATMVLSSCALTQDGPDTFDGHYTARLLDADTVRFTIRGRINFGGSNRDMHAFVVEWIDGTTVQRGLLERTSNTTSGLTNNDITLGVAVDEDFSIAHAVGNDLSGFTALQRAVSAQSGGHVEGQTAVLFDNSGAEVRLRFFNSTQSIQEDISWEVAQFAAG